MPDLRNVNIKADKIVIKRIPWYYYAYTSIVWRVQNWLEGWS